MRPSGGFSLLAAFLSPQVVVAESLDTGSTPVVTLPYGSFRGQVVGTTAQFLGMPFAAPPCVAGTFYLIVHFHRLFEHTALVNVASVFRSLPYLSLESTK